MGHGHEHGRGHRMTTLLMSFGLVATAAFAAGGEASAAETIWVEAEAARHGLGGKITSPLLILDDAAASHGSYVEVLAGNDSKTSMPAAEGVTALTFDVAASGTFRIWARVIAANDGNDSFWVKMDGGSAIKWNEIPLGSAWHWVLVQAEGAGSPAQFSLAAGSHTLSIGYREDGTKLDTLVVTSDTSFNPNATLTGAPAVPIANANSEESTETAALVSWNAVPGATSYTVIRDDVTIATGVTGHVYVDTEAGCYLIKAVASTGTSAAQDFPSCNSMGDFIIRRNPDLDGSATPPMSTDGGVLFTQSGTTESLSVVPAHGRGRTDFRLAGPQAVKVWALVGAPDVNNDSFWVRIDQGSWIRWNGFADSTCDDVHDSLNGNQAVTFNLSAGSHFLEFAYREVGATLDHIAVAQPSVGQPCSD
jgi:hypothetical protein